MEKSLGDLLRGFVEGKRIPRGGAIPALLWEEIAGTFLSHHSIAIVEEPHVRVECDSPLVAREVKRLSAPILERLKSRFGSLEIKDVKVVATRGRKGRSPARKEGTRNFEKEKKVSPNLSRKAMVLAEEKMAALKMEEGPLKESIKKLIYWRLLRDLEKESMPKE